MDRKEKILSYMCSKEYIPLKFAELMTVLDVPAEDEEELRCLDSLFPELIQGFLFGRPMPAEEFEKTCLMPSEEYVHLIQRLSQSHEKNQKEIT